MYITIVAQHHDYIFQFSNNHDFQLIAQPYYKLGTVSAKLLANYATIPNTINFILESHTYEKRFFTMEHIAMHINLLHSSIIAITFLITV